MARTKAAVDHQRTSAPAPAAAAASSSASSSSDNDDMDLDPHPPSSPSPARVNASDIDGSDDDDDQPEYADDLLDDATPEQAQALLGERSKRQTLFASMFADVGAASSLSAAPSSATKAPRGKRMRRPNPDDDDFNPDDHAPVRRSTRARPASRYDDDDDDEYDSEFEGGSRKKKRKMGKPNANVHDLDRSELMRTYKTTSDVSHLKLPYARVPDPYPTPANRPFGPIPGVPVGSLFFFRQDVHHAGIHRGFVAGIFGHEQFGCWSICVNGGYPEDIDEGDRIVFTGSGGRELAAKNLRTADQSCDQSPSNRCNASLIKSHATGLPIRVVRGPKSHSPYTPVGAYRYDGVYKCTNWEFATGKTGFRVLRFTLERIEGQAPLAELPTGFDDERWVGVRDQVLAFRGMSVQQLEAQAQAAEGQVGQVKESRGSGSATAAAPATATAEGRPKRAAKGKGKGKMKVVDSEDELSASESDSDVEVVFQDAEAVPATAHPAAPPATLATAPTRRSARSATLAPVPEPASASVSAPTAAAQPRRSSRSATAASASAATAKPTATRTSARLKSGPATSPAPDQLSDADLPPPPPSPPRPPRRIPSATVEITLPPPPRNAHLLHRKRRHLAQQAPIAPPSPVFTPDDWAGMARTHQAAVSARWRPAADRVFVHPIEVRAMRGEEHGGLVLSEWLEGGWTEVKWDEQVERTPVARRAGLAEAGEAPCGVDSGVVSSADASPQRGECGGEDQAAATLLALESARGPDSGLADEEEQEQEEV